MEQRAGATHLADSPSPVPRRGCVTVESMHAVVAGYAEVPNRLVTPGSGSPRRSPAWPCPAT
jgi:hypothetical protein